MMLAVYKWFTRNFLSCQDAARLMSEAFERKLTWGEKLKLKILCLMCPYTDRYAKQVTMLHQQIGTVCQKFEHEVPPARLSTDCKERIKAKLVESQTK